MADLEEEENGDKEAAGGGIRIELLQSYLAFAGRALRARWGRSAAVIVLGIGLTIAAVKYLPRTYSCKTVMMVQGSGVLDGRNGSNSLAGAENIIASKDNLERMIRDTGLIKTAFQRRPPLSKLKDRIFTAVFGEMDNKTKMASLVGTLESRLTVTTEKGDLSITVAWSDPVTTAELAEAARQSFLRVRHQAEISAFEDKMAILDGHATNLRVDIGGLVQQLKAARDQQLAKGAEARKATTAAVAPNEAPATAVMRPVVRRSPGADTQIPVLRERLAALKTKLAAQDAERDRRVREEQAKYDDLKLRLTSSHPQVVLQKERIAIASQISSEIALMEAEIKNIQGEIQQREAVAQQNGDAIGGGGTGKRAGSAESLPVEVTDLLERDNLDPALSAQLSGAVMTYGALRNDIFNTRVDLDTAQAAFNHRYQVVTPAEVPSKADKPKIPVVVGAGLFLTLLLALILPIVAELRVGVIRDRWQVEHLQLPVLAELRLPPHSSD